MKILNFVFLIVILFSCDNKKYILAPHIKGKLYSKTTNSPIEGVEIYNDKFSSFFMKTIKTDNEGGFITPDFVVKDYGGVRENRYMTKIHLYYLSREGIHKVIDAKEYYEYKFHKRDYHKKDTIDLGIIYFEDLENFDDEELKTE